MVSGPNSEDGGTGQRLLRRPQPDPLFFPKPRSPSSDLTPSPAPSEPQAVHGFRAFPAPIRLGGCTAQRPPAASRCCHGDESTAPTAAAQTQHSFSPPRFPLPVCGHQFFLVAIRWTFSHLLSRRGEFPPLHAWLRSTLCAASCGATKARLNPWAMPPTGCVTSAESPRLSESIFFSV